MNSISGNIINDIFQDRAGNLWIGTQDGGLCMYDKNTGHFSSYLMSGEEISTYIMNEFAWRTVEEITDRVRRIRSIYQAADGMLWCGTDGAGVLIFDPVKKRISAYTSSTAAKSESVHSRSATMNTAASGSAPTETAFTFTTRPRAFLRITLPTNGTPTL